MTTKTVIRFKPFCECCEDIEIDCENSFQALLLLMDFLNDNTPYKVEMEVTK